MQEIAIPVGRTVHMGTAGSSERTAAWTTDNPSVAAVRVWGGDRTCAITGVSEGCCVVTAEAPDGRTLTLCVRVTPEVIGLDRLKLVGRDIPA